MDVTSLSNLKDLGVAVIAVLAVSYILYQVIISLRLEHAKNQEWFMGFVNENNHQKTELITKVADNIAENTAITKQQNEITRQHTAVLEKLIEKINK